MADVTEMAPPKVKKANGVEAGALADVEAALAADAEKIVAVTVGDVRAAAKALHDLLDRLAASAHVTAAKDRLGDAMQFVHAHFENSTAA
jgi:hypothetical protein